MKRAKRSGREVLLRALPGVDEVLRNAAAEQWQEALPRERVAGLVREATAGLRSEILAGRVDGDRSPMESVVARVDEALACLRGPTLRPVINASGVVLHTNLGRAPLSEAAVRAVAETAGRYCNLEYDIGKGGRGSRDAHWAGLFGNLLGAPALVVNNNAAAVLLVLREIAGDGEVIVSRGEMVEIGDGFRIRDILEASGATVVEVGSTNRTRAEDYRRALGPATAALLRIHPSNFRQVGFTGSPSAGELAALARSASVPLVEDLGSGCLTDLTGAGIDGEPPVASSLAAGADLVTFSGDKLLGGPQAGVIAGRADLLARIRGNPLFRALRADKLALAALGATLRAYAAGREGEIPALRAIRLPLEAIEERAERFAKSLAGQGSLRAEVVAGDSVAGGGSTPMQGLESRLVAVWSEGGPGAGAMERGLRENDPPVVARIEKGRVLIDLRTVFETEEEDLRAALLRAAAASGGD